MASKGPELAVRRCTASNAHEHTVVRVNHIGKIGKARKSSQSISTPCTNSHLSLFENATSSSHSNRLTIGITPEARASQVRKQSKPLPRGL